MLVPMIGGFVGSKSWPRIDFIGKTVLDGMAILLLIAFGRALRKRSLGTQPHDKCTSSLFR